MAEGTENTTLGLLLRVLLKERSMSMRKLSELTDIDTATISRIINGKRKANLQHLERFADCLGVPLMVFFEAAGYPMEQKRSDSTSHTYVNMIQDLVNTNASVQVVEQQLANFELYSQTTEGSSSILQEFEGKLKSVGSVGPLIEQMKHLFDKFRLRKGTPNELALIGGALLYFIVPADAIPDYLFAVGYLDDAIAVQLTTTALDKK
ncbi:DUF1232 domain-containing protein [Sporosarcina sp. YIM B06819]|uniref:DUF1232 domain-containing protein n=1 Tax=Sporosarcina sp. YIM B06819 TaxID=3081769 RepID=UPI00298BEEAA|nr:DUF1232 domain-containing protein [Sporosarcina sp. YIM B06819]